MASTLDISDDNLAAFSYLINYDLVIFLDLYRLFVNNNLPLIISFYSDTNVAPDQYSFNYLKQLTAEVIIVDNLIKTNLSILTDMSCWEILDFFEDIKTKIQTFNNLQKWTRSNKTATGWGQTSSQVPYQLGTYESLENVSANISGSKNSQDDWQQIAIDNNLTEIQYTTAGGVIVNISKSAIANPILFLDSVIDSLSGIKLYGLDIDKKIQFINNDISVKNYNDTVVQAFEILLSLKKGDIPESPNLGINGAIGSNAMSFYYASLVKQLTDVFATDDSLRNFGVTKIFYEGADLYVSAKCDTFYNLQIVDKTTQITTN